MKSFNMSMTLVRKYILVVALLACSTAAAFAQIGEDDAVKVRERIVRYKMTRLIEVLDMNEATAEKFFVRYNLSQNAIQTAQQDLDSTINDLERAVQSNNRVLIKDLTELSLKKHTAVQEAIAEMLRSVRPLLTEDQYAKFLIFESRFQEELKRRMREKRNKSGDDDHNSKYKRKRDRDSD